MMFSILSKRNAIILTTINLIPEVSFKKNESEILLSGKELFINSLPHDKILDQSKFKAFADDKINANQKLELVL